MHVDFCARVRPGAGPQRYKDELDTPQPLRSPPLGGDHPLVSGVQPHGISPRQDKFADFPTLPIAASHPWGYSLRALLGRRAESSILALGCSHDKF